MLYVAVMSITFWMHKNANIDFLMTKRKGISALVMQVVACSNAVTAVYEYIGIKSELNQLNSLHTNTYALVTGNYCEYCVTNQRFKTMNVIRYSMLYISPQWTRLCSVHDIMRTGYYSICKTKIRRHGPKTLTG